MYFCWSINTCKCSSGLECIFNSCCKWGEILGTLFWLCIHFMNLHPAFEGVVHLSFKHSECPSYLGTSWGGRQAFFVWILSFIVYWAIWVCDLVQSGVSFFAHWTVFIRIFICALVHFVPSLRTHFKFHEPPLCVYCHLFCLQYYVKLCSLPEHPLFESFIYSLAVLLLHCLSCVLTFWYSDALHSIRCWTWSLFVVGLSLILGKPHWLSSVAVANFSFCWLPRVSVPDYVSVAFH